MSKKLKFANDNMKVFDVEKEYMIEEVLNSK